MRSQLIKAECMRIYDSCCLNHDMSGVIRSWIRAAGILRTIRIICRKTRDGKYPGHYETVKCFELVNNYNCSKKHKCLKKILDETKIYDIIINVAETAMK